MRLHSGGDHDLNLWADALLGAAAAAAASLGTQVRHMHAFIQYLLYYRVSLAAVEDECCVMRVIAAD